MLHGGHQKRPGSIGDLSHKGLTGDLLLPIWVSQYYLWRFDSKVVMRLDKVKVLVYWQSVAGV